MARSSTSFQPGNKAALKHGLQSGSLTAQRRAAERTEISTLLTQHLPHLQPSDTPLIDLACDVISDLRHTRGFIDSRGGIVDRKGKPLGASALYLQLMRQAIAIFDRLGIGPAARVQVLGGLGFRPQRLDPAAEVQRLRLAAGED